MTMYEELKSKNKVISSRAKIRIIEVKGTVSSNFNDLTLKILPDYDNNYRIITFGKFIEFLNSGLISVANISVLHTWCDRYDSLKKKKTSVSSKKESTKKTDVSSYTDFLNKVRLIRFNTEFKPEKVKVNLDDWSKLTKLDRCEKCYLRGMHGSALYYLGMADYCCTCYYIKNTDFSEVKSCLKTNFTKGLFLFKDNEDDDDLYIQINAIKVGNDAILCCVYNDDYQTYEFTDHFENSISGIEYEFSGKDKAFIPSGFLESWDDAYYSNWIDKELSKYKSIFTKYLNKMGYKDYNAFISDLSITITGDEMGYKPENATTLYFKVAEILYDNLHSIADLYSILPACRLLVDDYFTVGDC